MVVMVTKDMSDDAVTVLELVCWNVQPLNGALAS